MDALTVVGDSNNPIAHYTAKTNVLVLFILLFLPYCVFDTSVDMIKGSS